jgi:hypothetical protein
VAWLTLKDDANITATLKAVRDLRIQISDNITQKSNEISGVSFRLQAAIHTPKSLSPLPDFMSNESRIAYDTARAETLATLLDEEKDVPEEQRLVTILTKLSDAATSSSKEDDCNFVMLPSDRLDVAIAYLRRVHFFLYYSGKMFMDESQLLSAAPSVLGRSALSSPPPPPPPPPPKTEIVDESEIVDKTNDTNYEVEECLISEIGKKYLEDYQGKSNASIHAVDKRNTDIIRDLTSRLERKRSNLLAGTPDLSPDEQDAISITNLQNSVSVYD